MTYEGDEIAIVGMAGRFPGAPDVPRFWRNLLDGVDSVLVYSEDDLRAAGVGEELLGDPRYVRAAGHLDGIDRFEAGFFGYRPEEAAVLDPQQRLFLEVAWSAVEDAGYDVARYPGTIGVFAGASVNRYLLFHLLERGHDPLVLRPDGQLVPGHTPDYLPARVSYKLGLTGPSVAVQTACSSSLVAVCLAAQALQDIRCDMAIAGGVAITSTTPAGYLADGDSTLSPDGRCRAFDAAAAGAAPGSGAGAVLLKRLTDAIHDGDHLYAVLRGWAVNNDGADRAGFTAPGPDGQAAVVAEALSAGDIAPESIGLVEASSGGTAVGDAIEVGALARAFATGGGRTGCCVLGSVKTNIGNLDAASGVASLIKAALAVCSGTIPASLHFSEPNRDIDLVAGPFRVGDKTVPWPASAPVRRAGVTSLGVGGTNAHVIVEQPPPRPPGAASGAAYVLPLSARTPQALRAGAGRLAAFLAAHPELVLADVAYTLGTGRHEFAHRSAVVAASIPEACAKLTGELPLDPAEPAGTDRAGTDRAGTDRAGTDRAGTDRAGTDRAGTDRAGTDRAGTDRAGTDHAGTDHAGTDSGGAPDGELGSLARRWALGAAVDWARLAPSGRRVPLPGYPFDGQRYWIEATRPSGRSGIARMT